MRSLHTRMRDSFFQQHNPMIDSVPGTSGSGRAHGSDHDMGDVDQTSVHGSLNGTRNTESLGVANDVPRTGERESEDIFRLPTKEEVKEQLRAHVNEFDRTKAWTDAAEDLKGVHEELVERLKADLDTHLVFAGLLSAVLTTFNVQSYQLLQPAATDPTLAVLEQISAQLNSFTITPSFANSTQPARSLDDIQSPFRAPTSAVWINALWFSSLVCSLASASMSLMAKQWLQEQRAGLSGASQEMARKRKYRLNSLIKWRVETIVFYQPFLLQIAVILFLAGLLILVWTLHPTIAAITSGLVGALVAFMVVVTVLPAFKWDCCYHSPQAFAVYTIICATRNTCKRVVTTSLSSFHLWTAARYLDSRASTTEDEAIDEEAIPHHTHDSARRSWLDHGLYRLSFFFKSLLGRLTTSCFDWWMTPTYMPTWRGKDDQAITTVSGALDREIITMAYQSTLDPKHLGNLTHVLPDLPATEYAACFRDIYAAWKRQWGEDAPEHSKEIRQRFLLRPLTQALGGILIADGSDEERDDIARRILKYLAPFSSERRFAQEDEASYLDTLLLAGGSGLARSSLKAGTQVNDYFQRNLEYEGSMQILGRIIAINERFIEDWSVRNGRITLEEMVTFFGSVQAVLNCVNAMLRRNSGGAADSFILEPVCHKARDILALVLSRLRDQDWMAVDMYLGPLQDLNHMLTGFPSSYGILLYFMQRHLGSINRPVKDICGRAEGRSIFPDNWVQELGDWWVSMKAAPVLDEYERQKLDEEDGHDWFAQLQKSTDQG